MQFRASPKKCHFYNPDGVNKPISFIMPGYCVDGEPVRFVNTTESVTPIELVCEEGEVIEITDGVFVEKTTVSASFLKCEFIKHKKRWYRWQ